MTSPAAAAKIGVGKWHAIFCSIQVIFGIFVGGFRHTIFGGGTLLFQLTVRWLENPPT